MCGANGTKTSATQIFPLTADEVVFAGGATYSSNSNYNYTYYLRDNASSNWWWTLSPSAFRSSYDYAFSVNNYGSMYSYNLNFAYSLRPAVSLASGIQFDNGDGSIENPYTIK